MRWTTRWYDIGETFCCVRVHPTLCCVVHEGVGAFMLHERLLTFNVWIVDVLTRMFTLVGGHKYDV